MRRIQCNKNSIRGSMAGLQRFISYIYKYEDNEKKENAGFAKIEIRNGLCRMEVHIRNLSVEQPEATVYSFARNKEIMQGIPVGSIAVSRGNGDIRYAFETKELSNFGKRMEEMEGIYIPFEENQYLASQWKEGKIEKQLFHILEKEAERAQEEEKTEVNPLKQERKADASQKADAPNKLDLPNEEDEGEVVSKKQEPSVQTNAQQDREDRKDLKKPIRATELPQEEFLEEKGLDRVFFFFFLKLDLFFPFEGQDTECIRMQLSDLQELPRKYWYVGNNSFLLHGFFNYRHIIFGEMTEGGQKRYFIGVPGVFLNQEKIMAAMFGFPEFKTAKSAEYKTGNFGYWYRVI